jgi:hypothetical protein
MRRNRHSLLGPGQGTVDPGKDLFAYLFILIMVFSFMLLMTTEERHAGSPNRPAPQSARAGRSELASVAAANIGRLEKLDGGLVLVFAGQRYDPVRDFGRLEKEGRITMGKNPDGTPKKILYLDAGDADLVSLAEYLKSFKSLSEHGVSVAFAERVN